MNRTTLPVIILFFCSTFGYPQNGIQMFYRQTTVDPVKEFFSNSCDSRVATCVERSECALEYISNNQCNNRALICCTNQHNQEDPSTIVFPESSPRTPASMTTRKQTTAVPTRRTTTSTTTTTTTTEEPIEDWLAPDCGTQQSIGPSSTDIRDSNRGEFPWNVEIYSKEESFAGLGILQVIFLCGGTLIDNLVVLTSANCVTSRNISNLFVNAGVWNVEDVDEKRQMRKVEKVIRHPEFQHTSRVSSLALLVLDDQVDFSRTVNRICLPDTDIDFDESTCFLTGWGSSGENPSETLRAKLKVVEMKQLKRKNCQNKIRRTMSPYVLHESFQCGYEESENHVCPFDVGSPLICTIPKRETQFYQVGIFVWNRFVDTNADCTNSEGVVNLFTNTSQFRSWIDAELEKIDRDIHIYRPQMNDYSDETGV